MKNTEFCHLHVHNEYSHLDGFGSAKDYVTRAKEMGFEYLALTNHGNVDGCIEWQEECLKQDITPIIGCEIYVTDDMNDKSSNRGHMVLLVKNEDGWKELLRLLTDANLDGFYRKSRVDYNWIKKANFSGFEVLTACANSFIYLKHGFDILFDLKKQTNVWLEIMPHNFEIQRKHHKELLALEIDDFEFVATNDCHYINKDDAEIQEVLLAIQRRAKWNDKNRWKFEIEGLHLCSADEMNQALKLQGDFEREQIIEAMHNTVKIAKTCSDFRISKKQFILPLPPSFESKNPEEIIDEICRSSRYWRDDQKYVERYEEEFSIIRKKGFFDYFLIVYDFLDFCRKNDIAVGPGRGSVGGSLLALYLGITDPDIDPIKHNLLFSRFINEDRIDWPDIDIDVEKKERDKAIAYLKETYGEDNVCAISNVSHLNGRGIVRDVGSVFELPVSDIDRFAKSIIGTEKGAIEDALEEDIGREFDKKYPGEVDIMIALEGTIKNRGQHAAGVIISADNLRTSGRCNLVRGKKGLYVCNWDMAWCEHQGLMKLDVLGLATLSVVKECIRLISNDFYFFYHPESDSFFWEKKYINLEEELDPLCEQVDFDFQYVGLHDKKVFDEINKGNVGGAFQISARALSQLCRDIEIESIDDIIAANALVRPGPWKSGMTEKYIKRKHGERWHYSHSIYEEITKDTYGLLVYQEQVMQVISRMAGMSYVESDKIRKVIGKKRDPIEFEPYKKKFMDGCKKEKTFSNKEAINFWDGLLEWAQYGFNKCLSGDTELIRSSFNQYTGKTITLSKLYEDWNSKSPIGEKYRKQGLQIIQMYDDNRCRPGRVIGIYYQGIKKTFLIKTKTGKKIKATTNHRLYTYKGYKFVGDLKIGDRLAVIGQRQESITEKKGQKWRKINTKGKRGFQKGKDNPSYVDGRTKLLEDAKNDVFYRSGNICEHCKKTAIKGEFAHIVLLENLDFDYSKYHNVNNLLYLCNSCHKKFDYEKGERKKRYSTGYPIFYDKIVSVEVWGEEEVFDVEMEGPNHNFIANEIVSHNSHSVEYSVLAYRTMWLKTYFPIQFFCATLSYGEFNEAAKDPGKHKQTVINEVLDAGYNIVFPKKEKSDPQVWIFEGDTLYAPFNEVKGIGGKQAEKIVVKKKKSSGNLSGFFTDEDFDHPIISKPQGKNDLVLSEILADNLDIQPSEDIQRKYFYFVVPNKKVDNPYIKKVRTRRNSEVKDCQKCGLRAECSQVVLSSLGIYNVAIIGEAPGSDEDEKGEGFVGDSGVLLWNNMSYSRQNFYVCNVCKCWPSVTKTPKIKHIEICRDTWLLNELKSIDCNLALVFGNTGLKCFKGIDSGITTMSGKTEYISKYDLWVCWCVHPSSVLRNRRENMPLFEKGINNFIKEFERWKK